MNAPALATWSAAQRRCGVCALRRRREPADRARNGAAARRRL